MSKITIENYRGFDIEFETSNEKFQCICTEESTKESTSYSSIKKFIDDFKKQNLDFKSFWIEPIPFGWKSDKLKVIGIRKDLRFVAENEKGEKVQISDYDLCDYMLCKEENDIHNSQLQVLKQKEKVFDENIKEERKQIVSKMTIVTLKDFKSSLNG